MRVFRGFDNLPEFNGAVATVGSFDGLHRGHQSLLEVATRAASECGGESIVLTFEPHPRVILGRAEGLRLLTTSEEKITLLERLGVDNLIIIPFDREFSRISDREFICNYLVEKLNISTLVVGYNHHFGRGSEGSYQSLLTMGEQMGFDVHRVNEWRDDHNSNVSSTVIRSLISRGDIERAIELTSRPYMIIASVDSEGRVWVVDALKQLPNEGRYRALINGVEGEVMVDESGVMWCNEPGQRVTFEITNRLC